MAAYNANKFMESMGRTTNINGKKEAQMHLPPGTEDTDMRHMRDTAATSLLGGVTTIDGEQVTVQHYQTVRGPVAVDDIDSSKVRLYVPMDKAKSRDKDGDVVFEVWYDGNPLTAETEKGRKIMVVSFPVDEFESPEAASDIRSSKAEDVVALQDKVKTLEAEKEAREGHDRTSGLVIYGTLNLDTEISNAKDALAEARRQLDKEDSPQ